MNKDEAIKILKIYRPDRPRTTERRRLQQAIDVILDENKEKPFMVQCRNEAIQKNLPLYFIYYEKTGVFEVYVTKTKELYEKRHTRKFLTDYEFRKLVDSYLSSYAEGE